MTASELKKKEKCRHPEIAALAGSVLFTALIFLGAIFFSDEMAEYVLDGLKISTRVIIPSVFPFLLLTDVAVRFIRFERIGGIRRAFEHIFHTNGAALPAYVCGILCGFPLGAKLALMMYKNGKISKCECERLIAFANNASPGYVICAVGIGLRGSLADGIILYVSMVASSLIAGAVIGINKHKSTNSHFISWQSYSFVESVKSAVAICLHITGFVTVFSIAVGAIDRFIRWEVPKAIIIPFFEIGNAAVYLSDLYIIPSDLTLSLTAFSIAFSGLSVSAQTLALIDKSCDISMKRYLPRKLIQGGVAALITLIICIVKGL